MIPGERSNMTGRRLRIAFVIDDLGYGGAQRQLSVITEGLSEVADPQVYCLSQTTHPFAGIIRDRGTRVVVLRRAHGFDVGRLRGLVREFRTQKIDIVHGFLDAANIYAYFAARLTRIPCVLSLRNEILRVRGVRAWTLRRALRRADGITTNSKAGRRFLIDSLSIPSRRVAFVPNAIKPPPSSDPAPAPGRPIIGFVGRLAKQKRVDRLVDAFAELADSFPRAVLTVVGDGPERDALEGQVRRLGVETRVEMTGLVDDVEKRMREFTCVVLPSAFEGFPNVVMEALAIGVPVIACPVGDVEDVVLNGHTGYLIEDDSPAALAALIERVLTDETLWRRTREEGPALIQEKHSVEAAIDELVPVYDSLVGGG
jgi:glycosyltransferase involved in cell wall biosynthesis